MNYKDRIIEKIADKACNSISSRIVRSLQKMTDCMLSGDDMYIR